MKWLLFISDVFPPCFAPRQGCLCRWIKQNTDWKIVALHPHVAAVEYSKTFDYLVGYVDEDYTFSWEDGAAGITWKSSLMRFCSGKISVFDLSRVLLSKVQSRIFGHGTQFQARKLIRMLAKRHVFSTIICSSGGGDVFHVGEYARKKLRCKIVHDIRDLAEERCDEPPETWSWRSRHNLACRNRIFRNADWLIAVMKSHVEYLKQINGKSSCVHNGFDPNVFSRVQPQVNEVFEIVHTGTVRTALSKEALQIFFSGLEKIVKNLSDEIAIKVVFYASEMTFNNNVLPFITEGLARYIEHRSCVRPEDLKEVFAKAAILLTFSHQFPNGLGAISTKLFEYMSSGRPILEVTNGVRSEEEDIVRNCGSGTVVSDDHSVAEYVRIQHEEWKRNGTTKCSPDWKYINEFSRENESACIFKKICDVIAE